VEEGVGGMRRRKEKKISIHIGREREGEGI
jgi:hypothetical protein